MASETTDFVDTWTGEADMNSMSDAEERAFVQVGLDSISRHGPVPEGEADRFIDALLDRLRSR